MSSQNIKQKNKKIVFLFLFIIFLFNVTLLNEENLSHLKYRVDSIAQKPKSASISDNITIGGDEGWIDFYNDGNCTGSGAYYDPYVIKDLIIEGNGSGTGISIVNSKNTFFRIENCTIFNCEYGIRLLRSCNGTLVNNNCSNNDSGIYLDGWTDNPRFTYEEWLTFYCMNNTVSNNIVNNNEQNGLYMRNSDNNTIVENDGHFNQHGIYLIQQSGNNTIHDNYLVANEDLGIFLETNSISNTLRRNKLESCGFYSDYYGFSYNDIDCSNLVNNGPFYLYRNRNDLDKDDFSNAGQIYLINCNHTLISGYDLSDGAVSVSLIECNNIEISHNNLSSNSLFGMDLLNCTIISILSNEINSNNEGIEARNVNNSNMSENEVSYNLREGIYTSLFSNNSISKNNINSNGFRAGIRMFGDCYDNLISDNRFKNNFWEGLSLALDSSNNIITGNIFKSNLIGVDLDPSCVNNKFYLNFFIDNEESHTNNIPITNTWNNTDIGNYWDNYTGSDNNDDGIGDIPHLIDYSSLIFDYLPIIDNLTPVITINSPNANQEFANNSPSFNIRVEEMYLDLIWYTLDGGLNNYTITENGTINQYVWSSLPYGSVKLQFYAMDKTGKIGFAEININKEDVAIPGFNLTLLVISIFILSLIIVRVNFSRVLIRKK